MFETKWYYYLFFLITLGSACRHGNSNLKILRGYEVSPSSLMFRVTAEMDASCTGTLVDDGIILTAAHCGDIKKVNFGNPISGALDERQIRAVKDDIVHPCYEGGRPEFDLQLLLLEDSASAGFGPPIKLVEKVTLIPLDKKITTAGFGRGSREGKLHAADLYVKTTQEYSDKLIQLLPPEDGPYAALCFGDSGGPAFMTTSDGTVLMGVISSTGDECESISNIVDLRTHIPWIQRAILTLRFGKTPLPATEELCKSNTDISRSVSSINDEKRGRHGECRISAWVDFKKAQIPKILQLNRGGAGLETDGSAEVTEFYVSAPAGSQAPEVCRRENFIGGECTRPTFVIPLAPDYTQGKGRDCYKYSIRPEHEGQEVVVIQKVGGVSKLLKDFQINYGEDIF